MKVINTDERPDWLINALENDDIIIGGTNPTEEDLKELDREIAEYKSMHQHEAIPRKMEYAFA